MTPEDIDKALAKIFPGEPVPDDGDDGVVWVHREYPPLQPRPSMETLRLKVATQEAVTKTRTRPATQRTSRLVNARTLPPPPIEFEIPVNPMPTTRRHLLEDPVNVALWLREAEEIVHALSAKLPTDCHHITRLLLEAIPVVQQLSKP